MKNKTKILVVDDISDNIRILGSILRTQNYSVSFAKNGFEALKFAEEEIPDLILLDVMMPEMNGFEVCKKLKESNKLKDIPVIFVTAKILQEDIIEGFNVGGVDYITKPFIKEELIKRIEVHVSVKKIKEKLINKLNSKSISENSLESAIINYEQLILTSELLQEKLIIEIERRKKIEKELIEANQTKKKFLSIIAHDLRNPIGAIHQLTKLISDKIEDTKDNDLIEIFYHLNNASEQTYILLENLLEWAKSQLDLININIENILLHSVFDNVYNQLETNIISKKITINNNIESDFTINTDKNILDFLLRNLISNSIKFTKENGNIKVYTSTNSNSKSIIIEDNGIGIKPENIELILNNKSINQHSKGTNNEEGTGLGLMLCNEFIRKTNGIMTIESNLGKGTKVYITWPK